MITTFFIDWSLQPERETPIIKGVKQKYHVSDVLNMNCTSNAHDAQLKWFVNDDEVSQRSIHYQLVKTLVLIQIQSAI